MPIQHVLPALKVWRVKVKAKTQKCFLKNKKQQQTFKYKPPDWPTPRSVAKCFDQGRNQGDSGVSTTDLKTNRMSLSLVFDRLRSLKGTK